jgi:signal transduction histidine kinase
MLWLRVPGLVTAGVTNLLAFGVLSLAAFEALARARREPALVWFWTPLAAMLGVFGLLQVGLTLRLLTQGVALPAPPTWWYGGWGLFIVLGAGLMLARVPPTARPGARLRLGLDAALFAVAFFLVLWVVGIQGIQGGPLGALEKAGLYLLFGGLSGTLGLSAQALWQDRRFLWGPFGLLQAVLLLACLVLARIIFLFMAGEFSQDHPIRVLTGFPIVVLVALVPSLTWADHPKPASWNRLEDLLPNLPALAALAAYALDFVRRGTGDFTATILLVLTFLLLLARQVMTFLDLRNLHESLGLRVDEQTRDLAQSQDLLLRTQRMNLVATLGAGLAHDVNNFIGASLLYSQLLEEEDGSATAPGPSKDLARLREALVKAGELTRRLMGFTEESEGEAGNLDLNLHVQAQGSLLRTVVPKNLKLDLQTAAEPLLIRAKPTFLDQVLVNLVSNARDATPSGGRISLSVARENQCAVLTVADSGCGMPPEVQARIFEPFFTTKPPGKGTGLGLSAVGRLVEELDGKLELHSEVGIGTTFRISFKLASGEGA